MQIDVLFNLDSNIVLFFQVLPQNPLKMGPDINERMGEDIPAFLSVPLKYTF